MALFSRPTGHTYCRIVKRADPGANDPQKHHLLFQNQGIFRGKSGSVLRYAITVPVKIVRRQKAAGLSFVPTTHIQTEIGPSGLWSPKRRIINPGLVVGFRRSGLRRSGIRSYDLNRSIHFTRSIFGGESRTVLRLSIPSSPMASLVSV